MGAERMADRIISLKGYADVEPDDHRTLQEIYADKRRYAAGLLFAAATTRNTYLAPDYEGLDSLDEEHRAAYLDKAAANLTRMGVVDPTLRLIPGLAEDHIEPSPTQTLDAIHQPGA